MNSYYRFICSLLWNDKKKKKWEGGGSSSIRLLWNFSISQLEIRKIKKKSLKNAWEFSFFPWHAIWTFIKGLISTFRDPYDVWEWGRGGSKLDLPMPFRNSKPWDFRRFFSFRDVFSWAAITLVNRAENKT